MVDQNKIIPASAGQTEEEATSSSSPNDLAVQEARVMSGGMSFEELQADAKKSEHSRNEKFKDHLEKIVLWGLYVTAFGTGTFAIIWGLHVILPEKWHWLDHTQLESMQNLLTGGVLAGLVGDHFRKRGNSDTKP